MLKLGRFEVVKVSNEVPYISHVRFYEMPDKMLVDPAHEWVYQRDATGVYQAIGVEKVFFIQSGEIRLMPFFKIIRLSSIFVMLLAW